MSMTEPSARVAVVDSASRADETSYVDWPAIFAGATLATAITFVLLTFGSAIGLTLASPYEGESASLGWLGLVAGLWILWVEVSSFFAGGYLAGRMRRRKHDATHHEVEVRDGSHGLVVWAVGTLIGAMLAASAISGAVSTATSAVSTMGAGVVAGAGALASGDNEAADPYGLFVDRLFRSATPAEIPAATRDQIGRVLSASLASGELSDPDRQYLTSVVATTAGVDEAAATQRIDQLVAEAREAEATARAAADTARRIGMVLAFFTAASLLASAAAAYYAATLGGQHRDEGTVLEGWSRARP